MAAGEHITWETGFNVKTFRSQKGNKPWRLQAWCKSCGEEVVDTKDFNIYQCDINLYEQLLKMDVCPKCKAKLILVDRVVNKTTGKIIREGLFQKA